MFEVSDLDLKCADGPIVLGDDLGIDDVCLVRGQGTADIGKETLSVG